MIEPSSPGAAAPRKNHLDLLMDDRMEMDDQIIQPSFLSSPPVQFPAPHGEGRIRDFIQFPTVTDLHVEALENETVSILGNLLTPNVLPRLTKLTVGITDGEFRTIEGVVAALITSRNVAEWCKPIGWLVIQCDIQARPSPPFEAWLRERVKLVEIDVSDDLDYTEVDDEDEGGGSALLSPHT